MLNYTSMKGLWILVFLFTFAAVGCSGEPTEQKATPSSSPEPLADAPHSSPTPGEPIANQAVTGNSDRQGGARAGEGSPSSSTGSAEEGKIASLSHQHQQETGVSPAEWRRKNFKPRPFSDFRELRGYEEVNRLIPQPPSHRSEGTFR